MEERLPDGDVPDPFFPIAASHQDFAIGHREFIAGVTVIS